MYLFRRSRLRVRFFHILAWLITGNFGGKFIPFGDVLRPYAGREIKISGFQVFPARVKDKRSKKAVVIPNQRKPDI